MDDKIILHSTHCPKCKVVELKLKQKGIVYEENTDIEVMKSKGMMSAPHLEVNGQLLDFAEAIKWIGER